MLQEESFVPHEESFMLQGKSRVLHEERKSCITGKKALC